MEEEKFSFTGSFQKGKEYVDTQIELLKLKALARGSRIFGSLVLDVAKIIFLLFIIFFLSMALGFFLGELMESYALGFLMTAVIFMVILVLLRVFEVKLELLFMDLTIRKISSKWDDDQDDEGSSAEQPLGASLNDQPLKNDIYEQSTENK